MLTSQCSRLFETEGQEDWFNELYPDDELDSKAFHGQS